MRVPLIVSWAKPDPHHPMQKKLAIPAQSVTHDVVTCVDLMPTILKIAGAKVSEDVVIDGFDISPYFIATEGTHRPQEFLTHFPHKHRDTLFSTYRQKNWKIIYNYASDKWELYNLKLDPFEKTNMVGKQPELALSLATEMVKQLDAQKAVYPTSISSGKEVKPKLGSL